MNHLFNTMKHNYTHATVSKAAFSTTSYWVPISERYRSQGLVGSGLATIKEALTIPVKKERSKKIHLSIPPNGKVDFHYQASPSIKIPKPRKIKNLDRSRHPYVSQSRQGVTWGGGSTISAITEFVSPKVEETTYDEGATDELREDGHVTETGLEQFLQRPVKIYETTWEVGDALRVYEIYPWKEYLRDSVIKDKVNNYAYIQGKMHIKVLINGTQFHYGKSILSYRPLPSTCELVRAPGNAQYVDNYQFSQRLNVVIDPTESEAGEMTLPFVWYNNWLRLGVTQDLEDMGELILSSFNPLANAAGGTEGCSISIFAYMSDVKLAGPTSYQSQSAMGKDDEYGDGVVSRPASAVAKYARMLTSVPLIGPYARATEMGAAAVSSIAKLFGFSRPINVNQIDKYRPTYMGNMANDAIPEAVDKLTIDPKQELTIDPRVVGYSCAEDQLNIKHFVSRESYIGKYRWSNNSLVGDLLWNSRVTPRLFEFENNVTLGDVFHLTPMALVLQCFQYWRGSVEFRFDICASKFHKGRLRFVWDPKAESGTEPDWAASFSRVVDLSKERTFSMKIGMNQEVAFLQGSTSLPASSENHSPTYETTTVLDLANDEGLTNGVLKCYVLNSLVAPDDATEPVEINVFAKMGDDAEFALPRGGYTKLSYISQSYVSQSETDAAQAPDSVPTTQEEVPVSDIIGPKEIDVTDLIHFGESITSFRQVLKRYNYATTRTINLKRNTGLYGYTLQYPDFPASPGEASITNSGPSLMTLMGFLTPCFAARRGGIRWKHDFVTPQQAINANEGILSKDTGEIQVYRASYLNMSPSTQAVGVQSLGTGAALTDLDPLAFLEWKGATSTGAYVTLENQNNTAEVEIPYQTNLRFQVGKLVKVSDGFEGTSPAHRVQIIKPSVTNPGDDFCGMYVNSYCAAGEDFSLSYFVNVPPMYTNPDLS